MYTSAKDNYLYDLSQGTKTTVELYQGKEKIDVCQLLEDVSLWIHDNRPYISSEYLPFAILAVGTDSTHLNSFFFGFFLGKIFKDKKLKLRLSESTIGKDEMLSRMHEHQYKYNGVFKKRKGNADATESPKET